MSTRKVGAALAGLALALVAAHPTSAVAAEVIVKFEAGASADARAAGVDAVDGEVVGSLRAGTKVLDVDGMAGAAVAALERRGAVAWAEPVRPTRSLATVNDPLMWTQWGLRNTAQYAGGVAGSDIDVEAAWDVARGSASVMVGVVDTGVKFDHPDLGGFWWNGGEVAGNGVDDDRNGRVDDMRGWDFQNGDANPTDDNGHGTSVTSVTAAKTDNLVGMAGVAGGVTLIEAKALGANGAGDTAGLAAALDYLGGQGARVVNASIGAGPSQAVADAIAAHPSTLYVVAAGNASRDNDTSPVYPCTVPADNVLCAGASGHEDARAGFSNWGRTTVDLMAPGVSITGALYSNNGYAAWNGTSFASPLTAGVAALLFSHRPQATPAMVKAAILAGVDQVPAFADITVTGGRLNARGALDALGAAMADAPAPTTAPSISGTARMERTLTAAPGAWTAAPEYRYQWLRCTAAGGSCYEIAQARAATYTPVKNDVGRTLRVRVTAIGGDASAQALTAQTAVVAADAPVATVAPSISGNAAVGARLTGTAGTWTGSPTFAYQWLACGTTGLSCAAIAGATTTQLTLGLAQIGRAVRLRVTATGPGGTVAVDSPASSVVTGTAPAGTAAPAVTGTARLGSVLTATDGTWTGAPAPAITRQWLRCDSAGAACSAIAGAVGTAYTPVATDLGARLRVRVTAANAYGTRSADSLPTPVVAPLAPSVVSAPAITGTPRQTLALRGSDGTWRGLPAPTLARSWLRCDAAGAACSAIAGATGATYTLAAGDLGRTIRFRVVGANAGGSLESRSAATAVVLGPPVAPSATAAPAVTGTAKVAQTLSATPGTWTGTPAPAFARAWLRCSASGGACTAIAAATGATYVPTAGDVGTTIRHRVTATNLGGSTMSTSAATAAVLPPPPAVTSAPSIAYPAGATRATVGTGTWSNGPTSFAYQWHRCDVAGAACTAIWGATANAHVLTAADTGRTLRAWVIAANAGGSFRITTAASRVVTAP